MRIPVHTECRLRLQTTSSGSKLQLERGLWAGDPALRSRIPGVSTYGGVQETSGLWESVVETLWGGANSTLCSGIVRLWPQGSPLSPILFLFYVSELHETVHSPSTGVSALGFADDTNLLAFGHSKKQPSEVEEHTSNVYHGLQDMEWSSLLRNMKYFIFPEEDQTIFSLSSDWGM